MYLSKTKLLSFFRNIAWLTPKEKKVGVYPAEKREETLKKYFTITRYQTLLGCYIFLSQNGGNYFVIKTLSNQVQPYVGELVLRAFFLSIRGFQFMISLHFSTAKYF